MQKRSSWSLAASLLIALALLPATVIASHAETYYVSPVGDDANAGTQDAPWRSLQQATHVVVAGDTVMIADGQYPGGVKHGGPQHPNPGTQNAPIRYIAIHPGGAVLWGTAANSETPDGFLVSQSDWVLVDGLTVRNCPHVGIRVDNSNHVIVRRCVCLDNATQGILTDYSDDTLLEYNECAFSRAQHGIYVSNSGDRAIVRYNVCHDNPLAGIQFNGDGKETIPELGSRGDGIIQDSQIVSNILYNNGFQLQAAAINLLCVRTSLVANNLLYSNSAGGIAMGNDNLAVLTDLGCKDNVIAHNTVYFEPEAGRWCVTAIKGSTGNLVLNNIFFGGHRGAYEIDGLSSIYSDYNLVPSYATLGVATFVDDADYFDLGEWRAFSGNDAHSAALDPNFKNIAKWPYDLRLTDASPATCGSPFDALGIRSEWTAILANDIDGNPRTPGVASDVGCFAHGPITTYSISGHVMCKGAPVPAAVVAIGAYHSATAEDGSFTVEHLPPGIYDVQASQPAFVIQPAGPILVGPSRTDVNLDAVDILASMSVSPQAMVGGNVAVGTVTIGFPAPAGGLFIPIYCTSPFAIVQDGVTIPEGNTRASFPILTSWVPNLTQVAITAPLDPNPVVAVLTLTPAAVTSLRVLPSTVVGGASATGTVTLNAPAPDGGTVISLSCADPCIVAPTTVIVSGGATQAPFSFQSLAVSVDRTSLIVATLGSSTATATIKVSVPPPSVVKSAVFDPTVVKGGGQARLTVSLVSRAPVGGFSVSLTSGAASVVPVPPKIVIPAGQDHVDIALAANPVASATNVTVKATGGGKTLSSVLRVLPPAPSGLTMDSPDAVAGSSVLGTVTIDGPAPAAGIVISLSSGTTSLAKVPSKVTIPPGHASVSFTVTTIKPKPAVKLPAVVVLTAKLGTAAVSTQLTLHR